MPSKHSKNNTARGFFSREEKAMSDTGTLVQRVGRDSQLPFGHCCLSLQPAHDAVVSPSGHLYSREAILEYILQKTKELKVTALQFEEEQAKIAAQKESVIAQETEERVKKFAANQDGVSVLTKRKISEVEASSTHLDHRKKVLDETDKQDELAKLKQISPWIPMFTPEAEAAPIKAPPKRPSSPMTGRPLRAKDLIPVDLIVEDTSDISGQNSSDGSVKFICPVSRKTITHQKVILIKSTRQIMLESVAKDLAFPSMTCPVTSKSFKMSDVVELSQAASGFSASGSVETSKYRPAL